MTTIHSSSSVDRNLRQPLRNNWVHEKPPPEPEDIGICCFGKQRTVSHPPPSLSLAELYQKRDSFPQKTPAELATLWHNLKTAEPSLYSRFFAWKNHLSPEQLVQITRRDLGKEIINRILAGKLPSTDPTCLSSTLDSSMADNIIQDIVTERRHKAACYRNALSAGITSKNPDFESKLMLALCKGPFDHISSFFENARFNKIEHRHLFHKIELHTLSAWAQETLFKQAEKSEVRILTATEQTYNNLLKCCGVPAEHFVFPGTSLENLHRGYRLAALFLHPDKNPSPYAAREFEQLVALAEGLGIKDTP